MMGRPKRRFDHLMPLQERPAFLGVQKLAEQTADEFCIHFHELFDGRRRMASVARRVLALRMHDARQQLVAIAWMFGSTPANTWKMIAKARVERGDPGVDVLAEVDGALGPLAPDHPRPTTPATKAAE